MPDGTKDVIVRSHRYVCVRMYNLMPKEEVSTMSAPQAKETELMPERRECVRKILDLMAGVGTGPGRERAMALRQKDRERCERSNRCGT